MFSKERREGRAFEHALVHLCGGPRVRKIRMLLDGGGVMLIDGAGVLDEMHSIARSVVCALAEVGLVVKQKHAYADQCVVSADGSKASIDLRATFNGKTTWIEIKWTRKRTLDSAYADACCKFEEFRALAAEAQRGRLRLVPELSGKQVQAPQSFGALAVGPRSFQLGVSPAFGGAARLWKGAHAGTQPRLAPSLAPKPAPKIPSQPRTASKARRARGKRELRAEKKDKHVAYDRSKQGMARRATFTKCRPNYQNGVRRDGPRQRGAPSGQAALQGEYRGAGGRGRPILRL